MVNYEQHSNPGQQPSLALLPGCLKLQYLLYLMAAGLLLIEIEASMWILKEHRRKTVTSDTNESIFTDTLTAWYSSVTYNINIFSIVFLENLNWVASDLTISATNPEVKVE